MATTPGTFLKAIELDPDELPDGWPFDLPALRRFGRRTLQRPVTMLVGENGSGKSTLLEAIAIGMGLNAEGGSANFRFRTHDSHSDLHEFLVLQRGVRRPRTSFFLRAESFYNVATEVRRLGLDGTDAYGGRGLHHQSHGESFLSLVLHRFQPRGFYVLDEPEAALSPQRQLAMLRRIHDLALQGAQFVIATHAPILMACPDAEMWWFDDDGVRATTAEDTEHWQVLRGFLNAPGATLDALLRDDDGDNERGGDEREGGER